MARNQKIVDSADRVIAFWDGQSSGTLDSIERALAANKPLFLPTQQNPRLVQVFDMEQVRERAVLGADSATPSAIPPMAQMFDLQ